MQNTVHFFFLTLLYIVLLLLSVAGGARPMAAVGDAVAAGTGQGAGRRVAMVAERLRRAPQDFFAKLIDFFEYCPLFFVFSQNNSNTD